MLAKELLESNKSLVSIVIAIVISIGSIISVWLDKHDPILNPPVQSLIIQKIQDASELTSAIVNTEQIVEKDEKGTGFLWHDRRVLYVAKGKVRVGVNLSEVNEDSVSIEGKNVALTLPPLRVLESELDSEKSYVYSVDTGLIPDTQDILNLVRKAQLKARLQIAEAACSDWIIDAANVRTRKVLDQLLSPVLQSLGYSITVETQPFSATSCSSAKSSNS